MIRTSLISETEFERLDLFIAEKFEISRSYAQKLIRDGKVKNKLAPDSVLKPSSPVNVNSFYTIKFPNAKSFIKVEPEDVEFEVIYEDKDLIVINKPAGLVVHPAPDHWHGTLVNGLIYRFPDMKELPSKLRPGIVHRLDAFTSGLMMIARTQDANYKLTKMFSDRSISKRYLALVHGIPKQSEGILSGPIDRDPTNFLKRAVIEGGKPSLTGYKVLWSRNNNNKFSLVKCDLLTGRTHQIRVHMSALGNPIVGDMLYGSEIDSVRVLLHSWNLEFKHPITNQEMKFKVKIPDDFKNFIQENILH